MRNFPSQVLMVANKCRLGALGLEGEAFLAVPPPDDLVLNRRQQVADVGHLSP